MTDLTRSVPLERIFKRLTGAAVFVVDATSERELDRIAIDLGFRMFRVNGEQATSKDDLLKTLARSMSFPDYFGYNWDALSECIRDLGWLGRQNFALVFQSGDRLLELGKKDFAILIGTLADATFYWKTEGLVFSVVLLGGLELARAVDTALAQD